MSAAGKRALGRRLQAALAALTTRVVDALVENVAFYSQLPEEQLRGDITSICRTNLRAFAAALTEGRKPSPETLAAIELSAMRRAQEGVPLEAVLHAYQVGMVVTWEVLQAEAALEEREALPAVAAAAMEYTAEVTRIVASAYLAEREALTGERRRATQAFLQELLAGKSSPQLAAEAGLELAAGYSVMALALGGTADEQLPSVTRSVAARRRLHRVERHLEQAPGGPIPSLLGVTGGVALLPTDPEGLPSVPAEVLVEELARTADAPVTAGVAFCPGISGVPEAWAEAHEVLALALALGLQPGVYRLDDLILEHALARDPSSLRRLTELLEPLRSELLRTLEAYLDCDLDRQRTAARLHIHPNTLDYRLRRARDLSGLDPGTTRGISLIAAALAARSLRAAAESTGGPPLLSKLALPGGSEHHPRPP